MPKTKGYQGDAFRRHVEASGIPSASDYSEDEVNSEVKRLDGKLDDSIEAEDAQAAILSYDDDDFETTSEKYKTLTTQSNKTHVPSIHNPVVKET